MKVFRFHMSDQNKRYRIEAKKNRNIVGGRDWQLKNDIEDCAICHDPASTNKLLNARCNNELPTSKHYFHEDCLNTWVNTIPPEQLLPNNSCPRCRSANCRNLPLPKARRGDKIKVKKHPSYLLHNFYRNDYPRPDYPELSEEINPIPELLSPHLDADTSGVLMDFIGSSKRKPFSEY